MSESLGISIGTANMIAVRPGRAPVSRRSVLTLWGDRPAEVGVPSQNPELTGALTPPGLVLRGFVERVGDPAPVIAPDGSEHRAEGLVAAALEALTRAANGGSPPNTVVAAPAHWGPAAIGALRGALRSGALAAPGGVAPVIVPDSTAALTALATQPGMPGSGVVVLCDFGASGASVTLADAAAGLAPIGETLRVTAFSGNRVDEDLLNDVLAGRTAPAGGLVRLREACRLAKERLSTQSDTMLDVDLDGQHWSVPISRTRLEGLLEGPFTAFLDALGDALERAGVRGADLAAVAAVGGMAAVPAVTARLGEELRVPVLTTAQPDAAAATGAALIAGTPAPPSAGSSAPSASSATTAVTAADAPTGLAPTAWAADAAGRAAAESASDGSPSATYRALAWSQDDDADEPVPYVGEEYSSPGYGPGYEDAGYPPPAMSGAGPTVQLPPPDGAAGPAGNPWYRRPPLLFGIAAALAAVAVGGLAVTLTSSDSTPTTRTTRVTKPGDSAIPQTITVTGGNGQTTVTTVTPSPTETTGTTGTTDTTATTTPTTTPTTTTTTPTTTTTTPTTTTPTTTQTTPTTTRTTTAAPTTTVAPEPTTTVAPEPTTEPIITGQTFEPEPEPEPVPTVKPAPLEETSPIG